MTDGQSNEDFEQLISDSRRSFMKKGALASSALALGLGSGTAAGESNAVQPSQTLMFSYDYYPGRTLQIVASLQQSVTRTILGQEVDGNAIVSDTSEWSTALASYQTQGNAPGEYVLLFGRGGSFQQDSQLQLGTSATFFNDQFSLLEVSVSTGGGGGGGTPTPEGGTPTPEGGGG